MPKEYGWIEQLGDEDRAFLKRFLLASGSLKAVAREYGISYPTVRLRLDRLIEKVKIFDSQEITGAFERLLRLLYVEGAINMKTMSVLRKEHRKEIGEDHENNDHCV